MNSNLGGIEFSLDTDGKGQYRAVGASTWTPFLKYSSQTRTSSSKYFDRNTSDTFTITFDKLTEIWGISTFTVNGVTGDGGFLYSNNLRISGNSITFYINRDDGARGNISVTATAVGI